MRARLSSSQLEVPLGSSAAVTVAIFNDTDVIAGYRVSVLGADESWIRTDGNETAIFPSETASIDVTITLPADFPAGHRRMALQIESLEGLEDIVTLGLDVVVPRYDALNMRVEPSSITAGGTATFGLLLENRGNDKITTTLSGSDEESIVGIEFNPAEITLEPGETEIIRAEASGGRPWFGVMAARVLTFSASGLDPAPETVATFIQRPRVGRWVMSLAGLIAAISVFAIVITNSFEAVAENQRVGQDLIEVALDDDPENLGAVSTNPGSITGVVTGAGEAPLAGITLELFGIDNGEAPVGATSSSADGTYSFTGLNAQDYKVLASGAGFSRLWLGGDSFDDATAVSVNLGEVADGNDLVLEGRPGSVAGQVIAADPAGAVAILYREGEAIESLVDAEVARVDVAPDGTFLFEEVPSPAAYVLAIAKQGFSAERRPVRLNGGQAAEGIEVLLRAGNGTIAGEVVGPDGALGNVTIEATDGVSTISTVSLTTGDLGAFALRELPTPGTYTVTFTRDGYAPESLSVSLDEVVTVDDISVRLAPALGRIEGVVRTSATTVGASITLSGAGVTRTTKADSTTGAYVLDELPVPGSYTVTFSAPGHTSQTTAVSLSAAGGIAPTASRDATLTRSSATLRGVVSDHLSAPVTGAKVTLSDGATTFITYSADAATPGQYRLGGIPPGVYTLTIERTGSGLRSVIIELIGGQDRVQDIELLRPTLISGIVRQQENLGDTTGPPIEGQIVELYLAAEFSGDPIQSTTTDVNGFYVFTDIDAPQTYVVAVRQSVADPTILISRTLDLEPAVPREDIDLLVPIS